MSNFQPVVMGVTGLGGYAGSIADIILTCSQMDQPCVRLAAVCDPNPAPYQHLVDRYRAQGIEVIGSFDELLAQPVDAVWLPLPIDLHCEYTLRALEAGKAVMCEKPVAGCIDDVDTMIAARDKARLPVMIGYQDMNDDALAPLKKLLLSGRIGTIRSAVTFAAWPRSDRYFGRNDWAGRLRHRGRWVLDSPVNNATAHYVNLPLFLMGPSLAEAALPAAVEAELYRANPIENYDTASIRLTLSDEATLLVLFTHAVCESEGPNIVITGDLGRVEIMRTQIRIHASGRSEPEIWTRSNAARVNMVKRFAQAVRGVPNPDIVGASLETSRSQALAASGASQAAAVKPIPREHVRTQQRTDPDGRVEKFTYVEGLLEAMRQCAAEGKMLHESGRLPWTVPSSGLDLRGYNHFAGPAGSRPAPAGAGSAV